MMGEGEGGGDLGDYFTASGGLGDFERSLGWFRLGRVRKLELDIRRTETGEA